MDFSDLNQFFWHGLDLIFPATCGGCGSAGARWCNDCLQKTSKIEGAVCEICGLPQDINSTCETCLFDKPSFHALRDWAVSDDPVRRALHRLKYRRDFSLGDALASSMIPFVKSLSWPIDLLIHIPLSRQRYKERGYNQVAMIALPLALALNIRYMPRALSRRKQTCSQVGLSKLERKENVQDAFIAFEGVKNKTILLVDDVSTTGSTLSSGAAALLAAGARDVYALTVARALRLENA